MPHEKEAAMRFRAMVATAVLGTLLIGGAAMPALAKDGDVIRRGACSRNSDWKLKLSEEDGRIEVEYEVDQNRVGDVWRVRIRHDGDLVFAGRRTTRGSSGSFEVRILQRNRAGDDVFRGRAVNLRTGETCGGRAVWTA
ncbi:MAG TPA: hypothetical protein VNP90_07560 [Actinomycetota bacterium]|nr:hypothetical protein [Actinomycetota bacterium]